MLLITQHQQKLLTKANKLERKCCKGILKKQNGPDGNPARLTLKYPNILFERLYKDRLIRQCMGYTILYKIYIIHTLRLVYYYTHKDITPPEKWEGRNKHLMVQNPTINMK